MIVLCSFYGLIYKRISRYYGRLSLVFISSYRKIRPPITHHSAHSIPAIGPINFPLPSKTYAAVEISRTHMKTTNE